MSNKSSGSAGLALVVGALALTGCSSADGAGDGLTVVAASYPFAYVAERVGGDDVDVVNLTSPGVEPHDVELTPRQTAEVSEAALVVYESGFQPAVDDAVTQNATGEVLDAADVVPLEGGDPHFWLDPLRLADLADAIADRIADLDPPHAADYRAGAASLRAELVELDREYAETLGDCERHTVVVSHDAFGYLDRYGLDVEAITGLSPETEPTPADLQRLQRLIERDGITTVFSETLAPPRLAESLAEDAGVRTAVLDPLEGLTADAADEDYLSLIRQNLVALKAANRCR